jgi:hypothetical protein
VGVTFIMHRLQEIKPDPFLQEPGKAVRYAGSNWS